MTKNSFLNKIFGKEKEPDWVMISIVLGLIIYGLIMLSSATSAVAFSKFADSYYYFKHQLFGIFIGLAFMLLLANYNYQNLKKIAFAFLIISFLLLLLVFIPGLSAHYGKARSWINIFGFSLQPSEFVKLSFLIYLAAWLDNRSKKIKTKTELSTPFIIILSAICLLMLLQPDLGTLLIVVATSLIVYFVGGGSKRHIALWILIGLVGLSALVSVKSYQQQRFKCLLNPEAGAKTDCYQVNQSLIAVGSGGLFGRGLGQSRQKFSYIPEVEGDSIFSIISEETGFIFGLLLISLYLLFFYRGYRISTMSADGFAMNLAIGISSWIFIQAFINIGGMINLIPMTGVPLPLISYGGSSMMATLAGVGILLNISRQMKKSR
jgi:cell division protein FtsW